MLLKSKFGNKVGKTNCYRNINLLKEEKEVVRKEAQKLSQKF